MNKVLSDHFHITYRNDVIVSLEPDSQNPEMKLYNKTEYMKLFIQDEMELFCKLHHIPRFLWKKYGSIIKPPATLDYQLFGFQYKFLGKTIIDSIKVSNSLMVFL